MSKSGNGRPPNLNAPVRHGRTFYWKMRVPPEDLRCVSTYGRSLWPLVDLSRYSAMSHVTESIPTRKRPGPSGKKDLYTPHPGLRARVRRARAYVSPLPERANRSVPGTYAVPAHPSSTRSGHPQLMKT